ncbi:glycosyl transferase [Ligilactobacillus salitolerans]|uniref:Glycosyl transferase n=1 Tax=Ligilactobacillus salitolerans TaxID=1808352 RepID=A0A401ITG7_9LACO|nr:glycosyltransferase [Ligilactobacillus salitolerans]GBG94814.1 glycosyl transferase [Ligilactobacillus salitolerans]
MKILFCLENLKMDGAHRATIVVGNYLSHIYDVSFYSLSTIKSYFDLEAPLITAAHPYDTGKSYRDDQPWTDFEVQIEDLIQVLKEDRFDAVVLTAGTLTSFAPFIRQECPNVVQIAWMHNNFKTYMNQYYKGMQHEFQAGLRAVDTIIALTQSDADQFVRYNANTVRLYNPLTLEAEKQSVLAEPVISMVCRLDIAHKGLDLMTDVGALLPDPWQIRVAGTGPDEEKVKQLIADKGLENKVILRGALDDTQLREHYRQSSIFMLTSRWEGLPLVVGEAMTFGLPIVATFNTGTEEYLQESRFGKLAKFEAESVYQALEPLMADVEQRRFWGKTALERSAEFSGERIVEQWVRLLEMLRERKQMGVW